MLSTILGLISLFHAVPAPPKPQPPALTIGYALCIEGGGKLNAMLLLPDGRKVLAYTCVGPTSGTLDYTGITNLVFYDNGGMWQQW